MINIFGYILIECEGILLVAAYMECLLAAFNAELFSSPCLRDMVLCKSQHLAMNSSTNISIVKEHEGTQSTPLEINFVIQCSRHMLSAVLLLWQGINRKY